MKRVLTAPRTTRLKSQYDTLLSNVAFGFNLRRYISEKLKNFASELRASGSTLARERDRRFRVFSSRAFSQKQMHGPSSPARKLGGMGGDGSKSCVRRQAGASTRPPLTST